MSQALLDYFDALERLINNKSRIAPRNTRITNDAVAIEAGRKRGSIKRSRPLFNRLIDAIEAAASNQSSQERKNSIDVIKEKNSKMTERYSLLREQFEYSVSNNVKMAVEMLELKKELARLRGSQIIPLFPRREEK